MKTDLKQLVESIKRLSTRDLKVLLKKLNEDNNEREESVLRIVNEEPWGNEIFVGDLLYNNYRNPIVSQIVADVLMSENIEGYDNWFFEEYNNLNRHSLVVIRFEGLNISGEKESELTGYINETLVGQYAIFDNDGDLISITEMEDDK